MTHDARVYAFAMFSACVALTWLASVALWRRPAADSGWTWRRAWLPVVASALVFVPIHGLPLGRWVAGFNANFSIPLTIWMMLAATGRITGRRITGRRTTGGFVAFGAAAGLLLYPMSLGLTVFDPYSLGWSPAVLGLIVVAPCAVLVAKRNSFAIWLIVAMLAYDLRLLESPNAWDYVVDPFYATASLVVAVAFVSRRVAGMRRVRSAAATAGRQGVWLLVFALAGFAYVHGLGSPNIPNIGDEAPYMNIARVTAASGRWLPLEANHGLADTKPPLLFWQGIISTAHGKNWTLFRLRYPIVVYTFATALLVFFLARAIRARAPKEGVGSDSGPAKLLSTPISAGSIAAASFLCFFSTFQYGRPFLTNMPESFFVFLPFLALALTSDSEDRHGPLFWLLCGLSFGMAFLYKSFALVAPAGLALISVRLWRRNWNLRTFARRDAVSIAIALVAGIACFELWPVLDPHPGQILSRFVIGENISKLARPNYLAGLFTGNYTVPRVWLGDLANAGFLALPLILLSVTTLRHRARLANSEKVLWIYVLSFIVFYTLPAQRQENYLLPTMPALAVLLGLRWGDLSRRALSLSAIPMLLVAAALAAMMASIGLRLLPGAYRWWLFAAPLAGFVLALASVVRDRLAPYAFHLAIVLLFISFACALAPFDAARGRYGPGTIAAVAGRRVFVPSRFIAGEERYRFLLPGTVVESYDEADAKQAVQRLQSGGIVAVNKAFGAPDGAGWEVLGRRIALRSRQTPQEISRVVLEGRLDLLMQEEVLVTKRKEEAGSGRAEDGKAGAESGK
jgi:4-amino-4-deoxy-L-arabinose transferase-like glycosyltransferase